MVGHANTAISTEQLHEMRDTILGQTGYRPKVGVICGSGLSGLSRVLAEPVTFKYDSIPHFQSTTVAGHIGEFVIGKIGALEIICMRGRFHSYEGHTMQTTALPVKLMAHLGVEILMVTNAAGGIARHLSVGDLMLLTDHIGIPLLAGKNPLVGPNDASLGGPRFLPMSDAYDPALRSMVLAAAAELSLGTTVHPEGTYCFVSGPQYESRAECVMLHSMGGHAVGMSTVPEVVMAKHCGMRVVGLSLITNKVVLPGDDAKPCSHAEVLAATAASTAEVEQLVQAALAKLVVEADGSVVVPDFKAPAAAAPAAAAAPSSSCSGGGGGAAAVVDKLRSASLADTTPMQALCLLHELKAMLK